MPNGLKMRGKRSKGLRPSFFFFPSLFPAPEPTEKTENFALQLSSIKLDIKCPFSTFASQGTHEMDLDVWGLQS